MYVPVYMPGPSSGDFTEQPVIGQRMEDNQTNSNTDQDPQMITNQDEKTPLSSCKEAAVNNT